MASGECRLIRSNIIFGYRFKKSKPNSKTNLIKNLIHSSTEPFPTVIYIHHPTTESLTVEEAAIETVTSYHSIPLVLQFIAQECPILLQLIDTLLIKSVGAEIGISLLWLALEKSHQFFCRDIFDRDKIISFRDCRKCKSLKPFSIPH